MSTTTVSSSAAAARESARRPNGEFGPQHRREPRDLDLGAEQLRIDTKFSEVKDPKERVEQMEAELHTAVQQIVATGKLADWLDLVAANRLGKWSFANQVLATLQGLRARDEATPEELDGCPGGLMVMSAHDWKTKFNRFPRKGAKAIWILAPVTRRWEDEDEKTGEKKTRVAVVGFKGQAKFDACQTDGDPIPEQQIVAFADQEPDQDGYDYLVGKVAEAGYTFSEEPIGSGPVHATGTLGYTDPSTKRIVVDSRLPQAQKMSVIAHELGHVHCGHVDGDHDEYRRHRGQMETEAEATAYMTMRHMGWPVDNAASFSAGYVARWSNGDGAKISKAMAKASTAFRKITDRAEDKFVPAPREERPARKRTGRSCRRSTTRS